jgi:hypothetical protein
MSEELELFYAGVLTFGTGIVNLRHLGKVLPRHHHCLSSAIQSPRSPPDMFIRASILPMLNNYSFASIILDASFHEADKNSGIIVSIFGLTYFFQHR